VSLDGFKGQEVCMFPEYDWEIDIDGAGEITLATPPEGKSVKLGEYEFTTDADGTVDLYFDENEAASRVRHLKLKAGSGVSRESRWWKTGPADGVLKIAASAGTLTGHAGGWYV